MTAPVERFRGGRATVTIPAALALVGVAALVIGALVAPRRMFFAYLTAYAFVVTVALGALLFLMIGHAMNAGWPVAVRRLTEAIVGALPLLFVLFAPLLLGLRALYPWAAPASIQDAEVRELVLHKARYLNVPFFVARLIVYFGVWIACGTLLRHFSMRGDEAPARDFSRRLRAISAGMLPAVALTLSFASFDWLMSLEPTWYSTMYPVYVFAGGFVAAIALITVLAHAAERSGLLDVLSSSHYYALGRLLLAFTVFWAYAAFFQVMLIWIANKPEEIQFYLRRYEGPWAGATWALVFARFVLPFFALLSYRLKRRPELLSAVALWVFAAHYVDIHWLVIPAAADGGAYHWLDAGALLAIGGASTAFAALRLRGRRMLPIHDPALDKALRYESL